MAITIQEETGQVHVMRISGLLKKSELDAVQAEAAKKWGPDASIKLLVIAEDFEGWERGVDWGDLSFYARHGDKITKIAIVADPKQETDFLMFAGSGFRAASVKFFPTGKLPAARQWLFA